LTGQFEPSVLGIHTLGGFAVLVFFTISGYLVTNSWLVDPNVFRFSARRALRIWPAYTAVVLISAYLLGTWVSDMSWDQYLKSQETASYLSNIWLVGKGSLPGVFTDNPIPRAVNGSLWTIPFEIQCYVLLAICGVIGLLKVRALWLFLIAVAVVWYQVRFGPDFHADWKLKREMVIYFLVGSAVCMLQPHWINRRWPIGLALATVAGMLWLTGYKYLAFLTAVPYLTIIVGRSSTPVIKHLGHWGDPSYGLYLFAYPIQQTIIHWLWPEFGFVPTLCMAALATLLVAYLSWHTIEKHALRLKPHKAGTSISDLHNLRTVLSNQYLQDQVRRVLSAAWLAWMLAIATQQLIRFFPSPDAELNGDAFWTYLPNARRFLAAPWSYLTTDALNFYVAPLSYIWPAIWGANPVITQVANSILYLLCVLLMWRLATRLGGLVAGMVATALLVRFPELASYIPQVLTEPPYMFGLLLFLTGVAEYMLADRRPLAWLAMATTGLAVTLLIRPVFQLYASTAFVMLTGLLVMYRLKPQLRVGWGRIANRQTVLALALALSIPVLVVVKNGLYFSYWGISTGAGSGLFYGVSPFKMGMEPVYGGFEYDAGLTSRVADPTTEGHPLRVRADQIQSRVALSIVQSTSWQDNVAFFWLKFKAWMFYGTEELSFQPKLRQFRLFEWLSIMGAIACVAYRQWRLKKYPLASTTVPNEDNGATRRLGLCAFILLLTLGMAGQLLPVLYNIRYNIFLLDLLLMPLAGVGISILARMLCARIGHPGLRHLLLVLAGIAIVSLLMAAAGSLTRSATRHASWSMDPTRPGPTKIMLSHVNMGRPTMQNARVTAPKSWELTARPSTLSIPLDLEQPLNFLDGIWRFKLTVVSPQPSRQCEAVALSLDQPSPETNWYAPRPVFHLILDGKPHLYAIRGNGVLRPAASGNLNLLFDCPSGTVVRWHGAQLLRSTMPEAAHALVTTGSSINPYRADDIR
jgi:peptidoglycan/LPS O-acetylase OafA/YrhL